MLLPVFIYFILLIFKRFSVKIDFGNFALLWLIPVGALRALSWTSTNNPVLLVFTPLLWVALAAGISFFITLMINNFKWYTFILSVICILLLPAVSALTYWAFFSQLTLYGSILLAVMYIPVIVSVAAGVKGR